MVKGFGINLDFWKKKKVFLTGHTGFKGSWLSTWLSNLGASVTGYSLDPPTKPSLYELIGIGKKITSIKGDITDFANLLSVIKSYKPEIIFHLAAQSLVHRSYIIPRETYETNVVGTVNLLEAVRQADGIKVVINVTSDKCYENKESQRGYSETDRLGGYDAYASSKACSELVINAYRSSFFNSTGLKNTGVAIATARSGNVIGGGDYSEDRLIPDIIRAISNSSTLSIRNPNGVRPWQHVLEVLSGYLMLAQKLFQEGEKYAEAWNFGPQDADIKTVKWVYEKFMECWGEDISITVDKGNKFHETQFLKLDSTKAKEKLGWTPLWNINQAITKTVDWYKAYRKKDKMYELTLSQINEYEKDITHNKEKLLNK